MPAAVMLPQTVVFPAAALDASIRRALAAESENQATLRRSEAQAPASDWEPEIDSLVVVEVLCAVEEVVGFDLSASLAPKGGYNSVQACVDDLLEKTRAAWEARRGGVT